MKSFKKISMIVAGTTLALTACIGLLSTSAVSNVVLAADGDETSHSYASSIPSGWTLSKAQESTFDETRGAQWLRNGSSGDTVVLTYTPSVATKKVVITASTNNSTENATSLDVKIGGVALGSSQFLTKSSVNLAYTFEGEALTGTISITYTFLITAATGGNSIWVKNIVTTEGFIDPALAYGTFFLNATSAECSASALTTGTWTTVSNVYNSADSAVKVLITNAIAGDSNDLTKAVQRYDFIIAKYGYADFMDRKPASGARLTELMSSDNSSAIIITISTLVLSISSIAFAVIMKKKKAQ